MCFHATLSIRPTLSFPPCVHKFFLYVCVSIAALRIGKSLIFLMWYLMLFAVCSSFNLNYLNLIFFTFTQVKIYHLLGIKFVVFRLITNIYIRAIWEVFSCMLPCWLSQLHCKVGSQLKLSDIDRLTDYVKVTQLVKWQNSEASVLFADSKLSVGIMF